MNSVKAFSPLINRSEYFCCCCLLDLTRLECIYVYLRTGHARCSCSNLERKRGREREAERWRRRGKPWSMNVDVQIAIRYNLFTNPKTEEEEEEEKEKWMRKKQERIDWNSNFVERKMMWKKYRREYVLNIITHCHEFSSILFLRHLSLSLSLFPFLLFFLSGTLSVSSIYFSFCNFYFRQFVCLSTGMSEVCSLFVYAHLFIRVYLRTYPNDTTNRRTHKPTTATHADVDNQQRRNWEEEKNIQSIRKKWKKINFVKCAHTHIRLNEPTKHSSSETHTIFTILFILGGQMLYVFFFTVLLLLLSLLNNNTFGVKIFKHSIDSMDLNGDRPSHMSSLILRFYVHTEDWSVLRVCVCVSKNLRTNADTGYDTMIRCERAHISIYVVQTVDCVWYGIK